MSIDYQYPGQDRQYKNGQDICPDDGNIQIYLFSYFCTKLYIVGTHLNRLGEAILKNT